MSLLLDGDGGGTVGGEFRSPSHLTEALGEPCLFLTLRQVQVLYYSRHI